MRSRTREMHDRFYWLVMLAGVLAVFIGLNFDSTLGVFCGLAFILASSVAIFIFCLGNLIPRGEQMNDKEKLDLYFVAVCNAIRWNFFDEQCGYYSDDPGCVGMDSDILRDLELCVGREVSEKCKAEGLIWAEFWLVCDYKAKAIRWEDVPSEFINAKLKTR